MKPLMMASRGARQFVAEATEQRKEKNEDYTALIANDAAAKELTH